MPHFVSMVKGVSDIKLSLEPLELPPWPVLAEGWVLIFQPGNGRHPYA
jgi:hypothetical protein